MDKTGTDDYAYFEDINWGLLRLWGDRTAATVLDVGSGFATTSERIRRLGNHVTGIESSEAAVAVASRRLDDVIAGDLQDLPAVARRLGSRRFDAIIFADVLEHLRDPEPVLAGYLPFLESEGVVIVSLPNIGLWSVRLSLLAGRFEYADSGVLDRTHVRFFTRKTARRLIARAGLRTVRTTYNPGVVRPFVPMIKRVMGRGKNPDPAVILESPAYHAYMRTVHTPERWLASLWPGLFAFQMIFEARRA